MDVRQAYGLLLGVSFGDGMWIVPKDTTRSPFWALRASAKVDPSTGRSPALQVREALATLRSVGVTSTGLDGAWDVRGLPWEADLRVFSNSTADRFKMLSVRSGVEWSRSYFIVGVVQGEGDTNGLLMDDPNDVRLDSFQRECDWKGLVTSIVSHQLLIATHSIPKLRALPFASFLRVPQSTVGGA